MKKYIKYILTAVVSIMFAAPLHAQSAIYKVEGFCGIDTRWSFDGFTLTISNVSKKRTSVSVDDYDIKKDVAPWVKKKLDVRKVQIEEGVVRIGSCAFANCTNLQEVVFTGTDLHEIGWGAFIGCIRLRNISLPTGLRSIETIAFANCTSLTAIKVPDRCRVSDQAFVSCTNLQSVEVAPTAILGHHVFASEVTIGDQVRHALYSGEIRKVPPYVNINNCHEYGLAPAAVEKIINNAAGGINYDEITSEIDKNIPVGTYTRNNTYVLIIGNENYRFVSNVPFAIHDARVFSEYCQRTLGIPFANIHVAEDATKEMIVGEELGEWVKSIPQRYEKNLIVYYAGHGVPDVKNKNKAYLLPTDVRGTSPERGIALDDLYAQLGELAFNRTSVFLDACFSGVNRDNEGVSAGLREVEIVAEEGTIGDGRIVVFSAAQGNETAQAYPEQGHGLFTYYLLKTLQDSYGNASYGSIADNLKTNVSNQAQQLKMRKKQTPSIHASEAVTNVWRSFRF